MHGTPTQGRDEGDDSTLADASHRFSTSQTVGDSLALLTALLDHQPAMIAYWDRDLHNRFANHAYIDWFGVDPLDLAGMHIRDLLGATVFELNYPFIQAALSGEQQVFERTLVDPHGTTRHSQATYTPFIVEGRTEGFFVLVADVSELKRTQAQLSQRNDELAAAIKAREMLMATLTHDLRAPLGAIIGYTELIADAVAEAADDELTSYVNVISRNSLELLSMVNQLVEFEQIESATTPITLEPVDAGTAVAQVLASLEPSAASKGLALTVAERSEQFSIQTDILALNRVLTNLVANAIKFTDAGSVTVRTVVAAGRGQIEITDTGPGITPEDQRVMFAAFERGQASRSGRRDGIGLGLHICAQLTELTGGDIAARSDVGRGSTFTVSWPLVRAVT